MILPTEPQHDKQNSSIEKQKKSEKESKEGKIKNRKNKRMSRALKERNREREREKRNRAHLLVTTSFLSNVALSASATMKNEAYIGRLKHDPDRKA